MAKKYHSKHQEPSFPSADATIVRCLQNLGSDMFKNDMHNHYKSSNKSISN